MHDPMTVAFEIKRPWPQRSGLVGSGNKLPLKYRWWWPPLITVWHVDPERDGTDDSCDWFGHKTKRPKWVPGPRWHFWHWNIQVRPLQTFKRWAWSRCCKCGGRFTWGYSPVTDSWNGTGPRWFRGEPNVYHSDCRRPADPCVGQEAHSG